MSFAVEPADLEHFAAGLASRAGAAGTASGYVADHVTSTGVHEGIFQQVAGIISDIAAQLGPNFDTLTALTRSASTEVDKAALHYRGTDTATEARLDATY